MANEPNADDIVEAFREKLGPELDYLADDLAPAITDLAQSVVQQRVAPLQAQADAITAHANEEQTAATMKSFADRHPDWQEHEAEMLAQAAGLKPNGIDELEYLDHLYALATTKASRSADRERTTTAEREQREHATPPATPTFQEAFQAAKKGVRWD
jgi:hypothetical protein